MGSRCFLVKLRDNRSKNGSPWNQVEHRGWTFQEDLFSTRKIKNGIQADIMAMWSNDREGVGIFQFQPVHFFHLPREPRGGLDIRIQLAWAYTHGWLSHPLYPCLEFYRKLSSRYVHRAFTLTEDVFHAFAGVANAYYRLILVVPARPSCHSFRLLSLVATTGSYF